MLSVLLFFYQVLSQNRALPLNHRKNQTSFPMENSISIHKLIFITFYKYQRFRWFPHVSPATSPFPRLQGLRHRGVPHRRRGPESHPLHDRHRAARKAAGVGGWHGMRITGLVVSLKKGWKFWRDDRWGWMMVFLFENSRREMQWNMPKKYCTWDLVKSKRASNALPPRRIFKANVGARRSRGPNFH